MCHHHSHWFSGYNTIIFVPSPSNSNFCLLTNYDVMTEKLYWISPSDVSMVFRKYPNRFISLPYSDVLKSTLTPHRHCISHKNMRRNFSDFTGEDSNLFLMSEWNVKVMIHAIFMLLNDITLAFAFALTILEIH